MEDTAETTIPCCICGVFIQPNGANMCVHCLSEKTTLTSGINKQEVLRFCNKCGRYNVPPWMPLEPESKELLAMCLKKIKGMRRVKLVDAGFLYTESHSRRIKIKVTVQGEEFGVMLQQSFVMEYIIQYCQCIDCIKDACNQSWSAVVQVRQRVEHKKTFFLLEQLIIKHDMQRKCVNIVTQPDGIDFYFNERSHARSFLDFLKNVVPMNYKEAKQLVSQDIHSNVYNYKYAYTVNIAPICREDLIVLPNKLANNLGCINPLVICDSVNDLIGIISPLTLQRELIDIEKYNKFEFSPLLSIKNAIEFVIIDIQPVQGNEGKSLKVGKKKYLLADATVARNRDFGNNDTIYHIRTHLGQYLKPGDTALGYDLEYTAFNDDDAKHLINKLPSVILVRKTYPKFRLEVHERPWKLMELEKEETQPVTKGENAKRERDMELVMREIEEEPEIKAKVNLFKNNQFFDKYKDITTTKLRQKFKDLEVEEDAPIVELADLLDEQLANIGLNVDEEEDKQYIEKEPILPTNNNNKDEPAQIFKQEDLKDLL